METARIRMKGNHLELEVGKEYDLPLERANALTGMGMAELVAPPEPAAKEE